MLQTWNKFCFTTGYVEVSVTFPGPNENTTGYVSFLLFRFSGFVTLVLSFRWSSELALTDPSCFIF